MTFSRPLQNKLITKHLFLHFFSFNKLFVKDSFKKVKSLCASCQSGLLQFIYFALNFQKHFETQKKSKLMFFCIVYTHTILLFRYKIKTKTPLHMQLILKLSLNRNKWSDICFALKNLKLLYELRTKFSWIIFSSITVLFL